MYDFFFKVELLYVYFLQLSPGHFTKGSPFVLFKDTSDILTALVG